MMDLARYLTALTKLFHRFCYDQIGKKCLILVRGEISKRQLFMTCSMEIWPC